LRKQLAAAAEAVGERVLDTPSNPISMAMTLNRLHAITAVDTAPRDVNKGSEADKMSPDEKNIPAKANQNSTFFGSMLWARYGEIFTI